jgi:hypothetical protein
LLGWFLNGGEPIAEHPGPGISIVEQRHANKHCHRDYGEY